MHCSIDTQSPHATVKPQSSNFMSHPLTCLSQPYPKFMSPFPMKLILMPLIKCHSKFGGKFFALSNSSAQHHSYSLAIRVPVFDFLLHRIKCLCSYPEAHLGSKPHCL